MNETMVKVPGTAFEYNFNITNRLLRLRERVRSMRQVGPLSGNALMYLRKFFRIRNIYNSNAIEGNTLDISETRLVVEQGITLTGKSLKDQMEAKNLSEALNFLEELAARPAAPISETDVRQIHRLILIGIDDNNAGSYRGVNVRISGSSILPPSPEKVPPEMGDFSGWLKEASVSTTGLADRDTVATAAAAHAWFVQIHPFIDGNGRTARILANLILIRHGYPISIITREDRQRYYDALEQSHGGDLTPLIGLIAETIEEALEEWEKAAQEQRTFYDWTESIANQLTKPERVNAANEYEVWKNAMELFKSRVRQAVEAVNQRTMGIADVFLKDFGMLEFEKYFTLRRGISAKRTWFFRIDIVREHQSARYLLFFGFPSLMLAGKVDVTLHIAREEPPNSYNYLHLLEIGGPRVPNLVELGYLPDKERMLVKTINGLVLERSMDDVVKELFNDVIKHFP